MKKTQPGIVWTTLMLIALTVAPSLLLLGQSPCLSCEDLKSINLPEVTITGVEKEDQEATYCKVLGTIGREINFELLLPDQWNSRFVMGGGGGFVGSIQNIARSKVEEGYATVGTDTGHKGIGIKADWALDNLERQVNFGHLAVHRTAVIAKAIIERYYCAAPDYSYFFGCSRGGGQALIEAQRYPDDFDGIVAGAPILDWPATGAEFVQNTRVLYPDPGKLNEATISADHLRLLQETILAQCDEQDGLKDRILADPRDCRFDFATLPRCPDDAGGQDCFTAAQLEAIKAIYAGVSNGDGPIYPGFPLGCENEPGGWDLWIVGPDPRTMALNFPNLHYAFGTEMFKYLIFHDPAWDYSTYDFSNFTRDTRFAAANLNATSTDYQAFKNQGGKLIIWHGWNDPALSALTIIDHYDAAKKEDEELDSYIRLFMLPGVLHCADGPGPSEADWVALVRDWVEKGQAPERVIVTKTKEGEVMMTRPVFPYPRAARYSGQGDPSKEENFVEKK